MAPAELPEPTAAAVATLISSGSEVEISELDKSGHVQQKWLYEPSGRIIHIRPEGHTNDLFSRSLREWKKILSDSFLPVGFPHSVSSDYFAYQTFDSLQAFFSTITSLLASRALLQGLGVGDANSSATFALLLTILRDATSRVATIAFAHRFGLRIEPDAKRYRFLADLFNDTAFFLELGSPYLSPWGKVAALSLGEALRALCGVSAGASKAALSMHFAKHDNLAELNAKEASQETAVGLIGLLVGTFVVKLIQNPRSVVCLMTLLVFGHLWMNYLGVRSVQMTTLNRQRATILFQEYLRTGKVLSPAEVSKREWIIVWTPLISNRQGQKVAKIELAKSFGHAMSSSTGPVKILDGDSYSIAVTPAAPRKNTMIRIILWDNVLPEQAVMAWFEAVEIAWAMQKKMGFTSELESMFRCKESDTHGYRMKFSNKELWESMIEKGWDLSTQSLETAAPVRLVARKLNTKVY
ncbi:DUF647 domain-containing protein [Cordyceps fumosorosea ARSEF 2679]|uniref:DUF647 domain-containing protein n=1 Tax=Cordyceps fumosorosea (strain ARSEF 2679) TaxID=1081104 RepID=A0A167VZH0_CORFA|nr:DUF647 domain-containing protein [Cordyceps fumosorosea ARSEF 2679]OAA63149.1 DUF647 domain-containing protein [Cordyceps fumosorosea ARSEF 2679]